MALSFNGTSDLVTIPNSASGQLNFQNSGTMPRPFFSWSLWTNPTDVTAALAYMMSKASGGTEQYYVRFNSSQITFGVGGAAASWTFGGSVVNGTWYHLAGINDTTTMFLYANGIQQATGAGTNTNSSNFPVTIGGRSSADRFFPGKIADVAIWQDILSPIEIKALASGVRPYMIRRGGLKGYWPLDGYVAPANNFLGDLPGVLTGTSFVTGPPLLSPIQQYVLPKWVMRKPIVPKPLMGQIWM